MDLWRSEETMTPEATIGDAEVVTSVATTHVLLIEDDLVIAEDVAGFLQTRGMAVTHLSTGAAGLSRAVTGEWDAIVLDRMLPEVDGLDLLRRLRGVDLTTPVLMLTARDSVGERVEGLEAGADDYLVKPFALSELHARLRAIIRARLSAREETLFQVGELVIDAARHVASRGDRTVALQPREVRFLIELARHRGEVVPKDVLLERVWQYRFDPRTKIVETHVSRLRAKLTTLGLVRPIVSVRNIGYRLDVGGGDEATFSAR